MNRLALVVIPMATVCSWAQTAQQAPQTVIIPSDGQVLIEPVPTPAQLVNVEGYLDPQAGCPVEIVDAAFERPAQLMLTAKSKEQGPSLRLQYFNRSDKVVHSLSLRGWIKVKDNPYQLDSVTREFDLELTAPANANAHGSEVLKLTHGALGLDRVELRQIVYADGSTWKAERKNCAFRANGGNLQVEAK